MCLMMKNELMRQYLSQVRGSMQFKKKILLKIILELPNLKKYVKVSAYTIKTK